MPDLEQSEKGTRIQSGGPPPRFLTICGRNGLILSDSQIELLTRFAAAVIEWNRKINLISRRDEENIWFSHILHSLSLLFYLDIAGSKRVLDIGTGGGFPGVPLAIARPEARFILLDSIRKKTTALQDIVESLGLTGVSIHTGRVEEAWTEITVSGKFDVAVARAVAPLQSLIRWARPCMKETALGLIALKGGDLGAEIDDARRRESPRSVRVIPMSFEGSAELALTDKQMVIVTF